MEILDWTFLWKTSKIKNKKLKMKNDLQIIKVALLLLLFFSLFFHLLFLSAILNFISWAVRKQAVMTLTPMRASSVSPKGVGAPHGHQEESDSLPSVEQGVCLIPCLKSLSVCFVLYFYCASLLEWGSQTFSWNMADVQVRLPGGEMILQSWWQKRETWDRDEGWWMANWRWKMKGI